MQGREETELSIEKKRLRRFCFYDPRRLYANSLLLTPDELPDNMATVVQDFQWSEEGRLKHLHNLAAPAVADQRPEVRLRAERIE